MGNTVSAAEVVAAGITHAKNQNEIIPPQHHHQHQHDSGAVPPPECPMHQKVAKPAASECPVLNNESDINPYNRVSSRQGLLIFRPHNFSYYCF